MPTPTNAPTEQIVMGLLVGILCLWGMWNSGWFLQHSSKGEWLARTFGDAKGLLIIRILFMGGLLFGLLLALNIIRPVS